MAEDITNILQGTCRVFIGVTGVDVLPADTVAFGGNPGGSWREVGYTTDAGVTLSLGQRYNPVMTAQDRNAVLQLPGDTDDTIAFEVLEPTLQNLKDATGRGAITTVAPVGATPGHSDFTATAGNAVNYVAVLFEGVAPPNTKSNPRRIYMPKAMASANVTYNQRIGQPTGVPFQFSRVGTGSDVVIRDVLTT